MQPPNQTTVAHLTYALGFGGLEQVIVNLVNHSTEYPVRHIIITLTEDQALKSALGPDVEVFCLEKAEGNDLGSHLRLFSLLREHRVDVLQTYNFSTIEYHPIAWLAGLRRLVHSDHGRGGDSSRGTGRKQNSLRSFCSLFLQHYIVVSPDLQRWAETTLKLQPPKLALIYNGVDTERFAPAECTAEGFNICTVGRADPIKNQALMIDAFALACQRDTAFARESRLQIAGDGPIIDELRQRIEHHGMQEQISLLGFRRDADKLIQQSQLFVLSSNYEAMPMTILEALACAVPAVCTDVGGTRYLLSEHEGWLAPAGDASGLADCLLEAFHNPGRRAEKGRAGRTKVVGHYSIDKMVADYMQAYGVEAGS